MSAAYVAVIVGDKSLQLSSSDKIVAVIRVIPDRPEVDTLLSDSSKAHQLLDWKPTTSLAEMLHDLGLANRHLLLINSGFNVSVSKE